MFARKSTAARRQPRGPLGVQTVDAILGAVERILETDGLERLTTNHVAELAGVSIGSLYQYFPNKEALLSALEDKYDEDTLARVRTALEGAELLAIDTVILRVAMAMLSAKQHQRPIHRFLIDARATVNSAERYRRRIDDQVALIAQFLARRGDVTLANVDAVAFVTVHAVEGVISAVMERPDVDALQIARAAVAMVTAYMRAS